MYVCIERGLFNIHISNTIYWYSHTTFVCVFYLCGIAIQHSCFIVIHNSTPIFQNPIFNFFNSTLHIDNSTSIFISNSIHMRHSFVCSTSTFVASNAWCVCVVVQSAICLQRNHQHSCLDIELSFSRVAPSVTRVCAFCGLCPVYDDLTDVYDDLTDVITLY